MFSPLRMQRRRKGFFIILSISAFFLEKEKREEHYDREDDSAKDAVLQIAAANTGHEAGDAGTCGATEVTRKRKERKHRRAAEFDTLCRERKRSGPKDTDGEAAEDAADQTDDGCGRKTDHDIACDAEQSTCHRGVFHRDLFAEFRIEDTGDAHRDGKAASTEKVARSFIDVQAFFCEGGCPLCDGKLRCAGADHHDQHQPEDLLCKKLFVIGFVVFRVTDGIERNGCEKEHIGERDECENHRKDLPIFDAENDEEARAEKDGRNDAPAVEGMQKAHNAGFVFHGAGFHDGADENFQKTAADSVKRNGDEKACERRQDLGQDGHGDQTERAEKMRRNDAFAITDLVRVFGCDKVCEKLYAEIQRDEERDLLKRDSVRAAEGQKKKRREIDDDRLRDISDKASGDRMFMIESGWHEKSLPFRSILESYSIKRRKSQAIFGFITFCYRMKRGLKAFYAIPFFAKKR